MKEYFRLLSYLKPYWMRLGAALISIVMFALLDGASMSLAIPLLVVLFEPYQTAVSQQDGAAVEGFFSKHEILISIQERILSGDPLFALKKIVVLIIILFMLKSLFDYLQRYLSRSLEQLAVRDLRNEIHDHLNNLSFRFFHKTKTGQLISSSLRLPAAKTTRKRRPACLPENATRPSEPGLYSSASSSSHPG